MILFCLPLSPPGIAYIVRPCLQALEHAVDLDGIFRIQAPDTEVDAIQARLQDGKTDLSTYNPHAIASALLRYIAARESVLPAQLYDEFVCIADVDDTNQVVKRLKEALKAVPPQNAALLHLLLPFLRKVASRSRMNRYNLHQQALLIVTSTQSLL